MVRLTISLADRTHRALKEAAARQNRSMASIIEESLTLRGIQPLDSAREIVAKARARSRLAAPPRFPHPPLPIVSCPRNSAWTDAPVRLKGDMTKLP